MTFLILTSYKVYVIVQSFYKIVLYYLNDMLESNLELLNKYLSSRRISQNTKDNYIKAIKSFDNLIGKPLEEAQNDDFSQWYKLVKYKPSTIALYIVLLKQILIYALVKKGRFKLNLESTARVVIRQHQKKVKMPSTRP